jgi:hypothetical protein
MFWLQEPIPVIPTVHVSVLFSQLQARSTCLASYPCYHIVLICCSVDQLSDKGS